MNAEIKRHHVPRLEGPLLPTLLYDIIGTEGDVAMVFMCGKWNAGIRWSSFGGCPGRHLSLPIAKSHNIIRKEEDGSEDTDADGGDIPRSGGESLIRDERAKSFQF
ncbi:hypothetical protein D8674_005025 [Pyrus ussuriensis x Pyrus communis]|uniref:Uncharacterized protein n=1 Tax=Pyrus ussuriensis x Pyrus communis TaxID=2448454 RepID=A0A5N5FQ95_9ROSA|nr:hypothetical protein D8674_005025 [Pyrus ussuriensis x Pyrus communis]